MLVEVNSITRNTWTFPWGLLTTQLVAFIFAINLRHWLSASTLNDDLGFRFLFRSRSCLVINPDSRMYIYVDEAQLRRAPSSLVSQMELCSACRCNLATAIPSRPDNVERTGDSSFLVGFGFQWVSLLFFRKGICFRGGVVVEFGSAWWVDSELELALGMLGYRLEHGDVRQRATNNK